MNSFKLRRFMTLFLVMVVALFALTACGGEEEEPVATDDESGIVDEVEVEDVQEDDIDSETGEVIEEGEDEATVTEDEDLLDEEDEGLGEEATFDFSVYDANADLSIDQDEFGSFATEAGIDEGLFDTYDEDGDDLLSEDEFDALLTDQGLAAADAGVVEPETEPVVLSFNELDVNSDEVIDEVEFERYANEVGIDAALFADFDENGDGLDQAEFNALREAQGLPIPEGDILPEDVETDDADAVEDDADLTEDETFDFADYDADADLFLDEDEFGTFATEAGIDEGLFDTYDEEGDGFLDEDEFNTLLADEGLEDTALGDEGVAAGQAMTATTLLTTDRFIGMELVSSGQADNFTTYDLDGDGFLDENEFNAYLTDFGMTDTGQFADFDQDGDAFLNAEELDTFVQDEGLDVGATATTDEMAEVTLGEVVDGFFDIDGNIHYVVIDVEEEAVVQLETLLGDETLFDEEVDTILMSYNLLNVSTDVDFDDEVATADIETPARFLLMEDFGQDIPWVAEEIDAAALESDQLFLDPARFNVADEDFLATGEQDLLQMSHFEFFDLADHEVMNLAGEDLGDIDELVVDIVEGRVAYAIVDTGGFLGIGANNTVIPWTQFVYETEDQDFVLDVDATTLESVPTLADEDLDTGIFDADVWETDYDSFWDSEL